MPLNVLSGVPAHPPEAMIPIVVSKLGKGRVKEGASMLSRTLKYIAPETTTALDPTGCSSIKSCSVIPVVTFLTPLAEYSLDLKDR